MFTEKILWDCHIKFNVVHKTYSVSSLKVRPPIKIFNRGRKYFYRVKKNFTETEKK